MRIHLNLQMLPNATQPRKKKTPAKSQIRCRARGNFAQWLAESGGSLAITTYTSGKLVLVSSFDGRLRFRTHHYQRPMGIAVQGNQIALAVRKQLLLFKRSKTDRNAFALQRKFDTGKVDAHDVAFGQRGIYFANTRYNAIARASREKRFVRAWQPPFIDGLVAWRPLSSQRPRDAHRQASDGYRVLRDRPQGRLARARSFYRWCVDRRAAKRDRRPRALHAALAPVARRPVVALQFGPRLAVDVRPAVGPMPPKSARCPVLLGGFAC